MSVDGCDFSITVAGGTGLGGRGCGCRNGFAQLATEVLALYFIVWL